VPVVKAMASQAPASEPVVHADEVPPPKRPDGTARPGRSPASVLVAKVVADQARASKPAVHADNLKFEAPYHLMPVGHEIKCLRSKFEKVQNGYLYLRVSKDKDRFLVDADMGFYALPDRTQVAGKLVDLGGGADVRVYYLVTSQNQRKVVEVDLTTLDSTRKCEEDYAPQG